MNRKIAFDLASRALSLRLSGAALDQFTFAGMSVNVRFISGLKVHHSKYIDISFSIYAQVSPALSVSTAVDFHDQRIAFAGGLYSLMGQEITYVDIDAHRICLGFSGAELLIFHKAVDQFEKELWSISFEQMQHMDGLVFNHVDAIYEDGAPAIFLAERVCNLNCVAAPSEGPSTVE